jgi:hypothetical protein
LPEWKLEGLTFKRKPSGPVTQLIDFQLNKYVKEWTLAVNIGVHYSGVARILGWPMEASIGSCQLRARLSELERGAGVHEWTKVPTESSVDGWANQMCATLERVVLPQLARFVTPDLVVSAWQREHDSAFFVHADRLVLAAFLSESGRRDEARRIASEEVAKLDGDPQKVWAESVLAALRGTN